MEGQEIKGNYSLTWEFGLGMAGGIEIVLCVISLWQVMEDKARAAVLNLRVMTSLPNLNLQYCLRYDS